VDGNLAGGSVNVGTLSGDTVCFTPVEGVNEIILTCTDLCGEESACTTSVNVTLNSPPIVTCPPTVDTIVCDPDVEICVGGFTCTDPDGNLASTQVTGGTLIGDSICFLPVEGLNTLTITCIDSCGAESSCSMDVVVRFGPRICIDTLSAMPNSEASVCLRMDTGGIPWGGFDFLLGYDASLITFTSAEPGQFLVDCGWEYFTYRIVTPPSGSAISSRTTSADAASGSGFVRIVAIADMNNSNLHPSCLTPDSGDIIACLNFRVTNDWSLSCRDALIDWCWFDCGDNSVSNPAGDTLYISSFANGSVVNWEGTDFTGLDGVGGPPLPCPSDKGEPQECLRFCGGKIRILCPGEIDARADVNLNNVAYEIADAVLYSQYFIAGPSVFIINADGQIAASDVNADGVTLTVADLVYLIRVITGDEQPIQEDLLGGGPKVAGSVGTVNIDASTSGSFTTVSTRSDFDMGAGLFVFNTNGASVNSVQLTSRSSAMDLQYQVQGDELRVLVFNIADRARIAAGEGEILTISTSGNHALDLIRVEAATFNGGALEANFTSKVLPTQFALHQNYPNPFNPSTSFTVDFPTATDYTVSIYNIAGQVVRTFAGAAQAGSTTIHWDGANEVGQPVASGMYFYQISAGSHTDVRKMVLMK
jgi:hypothetical protein